PSHSCISLLSLLTCPPPRPTLFPYTTLFRSEACSTEAVPRSERVPCDPADPSVAPLFTGSPAVLLLSRTHEAREDTAPDQAAVRPVRCAPHTEEKEGPPYGFAS